MGTIAARDCLRVLQLTEQVAAASLIACAQGLDLRLARAELSEQQIGVQLLDTVRQVREVTAFITEDRALEQELRVLIDQIQQQRWSLYVNWH